MKFTCDAQELIAATKTVGKAAGRDPYTRTKASKLEIRTIGESAAGLIVTNGKLTIKTEFPAQIEETGSVVVNRKAFGAALGKESRCATLETIGDNLALTTESATCRFSGEDPIHPFSERTPEPMVKMKAADFKTMVKKTDFAANWVEFDRPVLTGVHVELCENVITMVAIDGFRLSTQRRAQNMRVTSLEQCTIPADALRKAVRTISKRDSDSILELTFDNEYCWIKCGRIEAKIALLEGNYPAYENIFPKMVTRLVSIPRIETLEALKALDHVKRENNTVEIHLRRGEMHLKAIGGAAEAERVVSVKDLQNELTIHFNSDFLKDMLKSMDGDTVDVLQERYHKWCPICVDVTQSYYQNRHLILPIAVEG